MATNKHGFTLVEIMLVVMIIAMLGATAIGWHLRGSGLGTAGPKYSAFLGSTSP